MKRITEKILRLFREPTWMEYEEKMLRKLIENTHHPDDMLELISNLEMQKKDKQAEKVRQEFKEYWPDRASELEL